MSTLEMILACYLLVGLFFATKFYCEWKSGQREHPNFKQAPNWIRYSGAAFTVLVGLFAWPIPVAFDLSDWASKRK